MVKREIEGRVVHVKLCVAGAYFARFDAKHFLVKFEAVFDAVYVESDDLSGGKLFETDWEVFVVRLDRETGNYVSLTFCCENAVS